MIKVLLKAPLANSKMSVVCLASLAVVLIIFRTAADQFGLTTFFAVGLSLNAGLVFGFILYFYPRANMAISAVLLVMAGFIGSIGYWLLGISLTVYFLTAFQAKNQGNKECGF